MAASLSAHMSRASRFSLRVVVLDVNAERDAALRLRAMIDDRTDNERRDAQHRKMRANRSPQIVGRPILNWKPSPPLGKEVREPLSVQVKQPTADLSADELLR